MTAVASSPSTRSARLGLRATPIESLPTFTKPARERRESIPADIRQRLLSNVWCGHCRPVPWCRP